MKILQEIEITHLDYSNIYLLVDDANAVPSHPVADPRISEPVGEGEGGGGGAVRVLGLF